MLFPLCLKESQIKLFDEVCRLYKEYEAWCRDTSTFVASYKPIMSNAITQAAMQVLSRAFGSLITPFGRLLMLPSAATRPY